jgi:hypothetical protein
MRFHRATRVLTAVLTAGALLFSQSALAAYLCPKLDVGAAAMAMEGCPMESAEPDLACVKHCQAQAQLSDFTKLPAFDAGPLPLPLLAARQAFVPRARPEAFRPDLSRSTHPPPGIAYCCFRI